MPTPTPRPTPTADAASDADADAASEADAGRARPTPTPRAPRPRRRASRLAGARAQQMAAAVAALGDVSLHARPAADEVVLERAPARPRTLQVAISGFCGAGACVCVSCPSRENRAARMATAAERARLIPARVTVPSLDGA